MSKVKRGVLWSDPTAEQNCGEMEIGNEDHYKIANDLADKIADIITIHKQNSAIIKNLIANAITEQIRQYLREYDNVVAEDILNSLKSWKLGEIKGWMSEVDFEYARHGKLSTFGDELKKHFEKLQDESALIRAKKRIEKLNTEPLKTAANGDGVIWKSNVLTIIDEELNGKKEDITSDKEG